MNQVHRENGHARRFGFWRRSALWMSGAWVAPFLVLAWWIRQDAPYLSAAISIAAILAAPLPAIVILRKRLAASIRGSESAEESAAQLKLQLETVRFRTSRLREELKAADRQARLSHQLTLLGQFTAGFMHEFNNPLAIVAGRIEVLLEERKADAALHKDLEEMLKETRYMGNIARTLLQALRRERGAEAFEASPPAQALQDAAEAIRPAADAAGVNLIVSTGDAPRVDVPEHVIGEVVRGLLTNAVEALRGREDAKVWIMLEPYRTAGAKVVARIEDNGPGVPETIRQHLFEPFVSHSSGRERLGLGLFLAASLLDMYDGQIRYEIREGGGAVFVIDLPPARFTRGQPYHWFAGGTSE